MNGFGNIRIVGPDTVEILEEPESYRMSKADVEEAIENVKANRHKYATDVAYMRRLVFFEDILTKLQRGLGT
ncbi:MAG TPA: hypothetical protein VJ785_01060 [Anaerolineales bacterium]|nr:hypothetical protein [Anaerolineales bacterium]